MKKWMLFFSTFISIIVTAQDQTIQSLKTDASKTIKKDASDTIPKMWKTGGLFSLNIAQAA